MAKVKTTVRLDIKAALQEFLDKNTAEELGDTVVSEAKRLIAAGISPVKGYGRFEPYSAQRGPREDRKRKYPNSIQWKYPGKSQRPVNLELEGDLMDHYDHRHKNETTVDVGIIGGSEKLNVIAKAHNEGVPAKNIPMRPFIPKDGEEFAISIMRSLKALYTRRLSAIIRKSNGR
jgi:hypothetical protein